MAARSRRRWSVAARLYAVELLCILLGASVAIGVLALDAHRSATHEAAERSTAVATAIADNPFVIAQVQASAPSTRLQPYAEDVMRDTGVDFVTIMNTDRTRYTHRDPAEIGKRFIGTIAPALAGKTFTETYTGTLGPSVRAVTPVRAGDGRIVALVSAGVTLTVVDAAFWGRVGFVALAAAALAGVGALVTGALAVYLRRVTGGRDPEELRQVFASYETVLHTVREGLLLVDGHGRITVANDHALELLGLPGLALPASVAELGLSPGLTDVLTGAAPTREAPIRDALAGDALTGDALAGDALAGDALAGDAPAGAGPGGAGPTGAGPGAARSGSAQEERLVATADRLLIVAARPAVGASHGTVVTLRDRTELQRVMGELESMRTMSGALRAQTHEFSNRLHTIASLIELGRADEALAFTADELGLSQRLADRVLGAPDEPVIAALMLGKSAQARARGVQLQLETHLQPGTQGLEPSVLVSILGNLIDNALDAAAEAATPDAPGWVEVYLGIDDGIGHGAEPSAEPSAEDGLDARTDARTDGSDDRGDDGACGELLIQVSDSGAGLSDAEAAFTRGWSTKPAGAEGRGIGLAIVAQLVRRLGGRIEVSQHVGAVFTVQLPLPAAQPAAPSGDPQPSQASRAAVRP